MPARRHDGRRRLPSNVVFRAIRAAGGPSAVCEALGISLATLARWRRVGRVSDPRAVLEWAALIHPEPAAQLALARALAGLRPHARTP
jgi:transposase-like protein